MLVVWFRLWVIVLIVLHTDAVVFVVCCLLPIVGFMLLCCIDFLVCWMFGFKCVWVCGFVIVVFADLWLFVPGISCGVLLCILRCCLILRWFVVCLLLVCFFVCG